MPHQIKIARGSRSLCACGCGQRKTSFRRRFASGHNDSIRQVRGRGGQRVFPADWKPALPKKGKFQNMREEKANDIQNSGGR